MNIIKEKGEMFMLASQEIINLITQKENNSNHVYNNNDYNVSDVLNFCSDSTPKKHLLRYPDGKEETFSFEE